MKEGLPHPDPIVETACLANVLPPVPTYRHHIAECVAAGKLSDAQIETVIYANQRFELPPLHDGEHSLSPQRPSMGNVQYTMLHMPSSHGEYCAQRCLPTCPASNIAVDLRHPLAGCNLLSASCHVLQRGLIRSALSCRHAARVLPWRRCWRRQGASDWRPHQRVLGHRWPQGELMPLPGSSHPPNVVAPL